MPKLESHVHPTRLVIRMVLDAGVRIVVTIPVIGTTGSYTKVSVTTAFVIYAYSWVSAIRYVFEDSNSQSMIVAITPSFS